MIRSPEYLAARRKALVARADNLRQTMGEDLVVLSEPLGKISQAAAQARPFLRYAPIIAGAGAALLVWKRPRRILDAGHKLISLWQYCVPLVAMLKSIHPRQDPAAGED
ncbi:YqjK family protein [Uliginosibacterium gangwonense]|uniref:YqjK family protein n=1 Tax=Uliginosibacterium gangwonense TaxID=392736 RepID=UPI00035F93A2|nr:YqjK family protein [Uliginosibacterium gangwonense]